MDGNSNNSSNKTQTILLSVIAVLLLGNLLTGIYTIYMTHQQNVIAAERSASYKERVETAGELANQQQTVILGLLDDYQQAAYDNPSIERITEQQLLASEFTLQALQVIAIQNSQIVQLLSIAP